MSGLLSAFRKGKRKFNAMAGVAGAVASAYKRIKRGGRMIPPMYSPQSYQPVNQTVGRSIINSARSCNKNAIISKRSLIGNATSTVFNTITTDSCYGISFKFADLVQAAAYTGLYDQYRITKITATFYPRSTSPQIANIATDLSSYASNYWVSSVDNDDATVPTSFSQLATSCDAKFHQFDGKIVTISFVPQTKQSGMYSVGANASAVNAPGQWIDMATPDASHYGIKLAFPVTLYAHSVQYDIVYHASFDLKGPL